MRYALSAALALATFAHPAFAAPERYEIDPDHTTVSFLVDHVGFAGTLGLFATIEGGFTYDVDTQDLSDLEIRVHTDSIVTLNEARDKHVRGGDFLAVEEYPTMTFTASEGAPTDATSGTVTGELTLLGETQPLTLDVTLNKSDTYPFGHKRFVLGISARGSLMRSDFGMTYGVDNGLVGNQVDLIIETEAMRVE